MCVEDMGERWHCTVLWKHGVVQQQHQPGLFVLMIIHNHNHYYCYLFKKNPFITYLLTSLLIVIISK